MHPQVRKTGPGKCPGCGMELIKSQTSNLKPKTNSKNEHKNHKKAEEIHEHQAEMADPRIAKRMEQDMRRRFWISFILSIPIFIYSPVGEKIFGLTLPSPIPINWLLLTLTTPVVFWTGSIFITGAYYSLKARKFNMSVLIATGVLAAYLFSVLLTIVRPGSETFYEAAALLVTFVLFGHWMEMKSRRGTSDALRALFDLVPPQARVIRDGKEITIPSVEIAHGDIVILRPGDKVPVDGEIVEGETSIDESLITGESIPVVKKVGDKVIGGGVNLTGTAKFRATQVGSDTVLAHIIKMVETAQNSKAPGQRIADKAAAWLVVVAISSGLAAFLGWYFAADVTPITALTFAVSAVVIACPDALGLATPTAVAVGTGLGAKHNILIKDAASLENTSKINTMILDKTGTLTEGKPKVTDIIAYGDFGKHDILRYEASLETASNHPLAKAIIEETQKQNVLPLEPIENFESLAGLGLRAKIKGQTVLAGNKKFLENNGVDLSAAAGDIEKLTREGKTLSLLAVDGAFAGIIAAADPLKLTAKKAVESIKKWALKR